MALRKQSVQINFRASLEFKRRLDATASREGLSTTQFILKAVRAAIKEKENTNE